MIDERPERLSVGKRAPTPRLLSALEIVVEFWTWHSRRRGHAIHQITLGSARGGVWHWRLYEGRNGWTAPSRKGDGSGHGARGDAFRARFDCRAGRLRVAIAANRGDSHKRGGAGGWLQITAGLVPKSTPARTTRPRRTLVPSRPAPLGTSWPPLPPGSDSAESGPAAVRAYRRRVAAARLPLSANMDLSQPCAGADANGWDRVPAVGLPSPMEPFEESMSFLGRPAGSRRPARQKTWSAAWAEVTLRTISP